MDFLPAIQLVKLIVLHCIAGTAIQLVKLIELHCIAGTAIIQLVKLIVLLARTTDVDL